MKIVNIGVLLALIANFLGFGVAYADTANPSSPPQVIQLDVYRNLRETGDRLYLIYANIPYTVPPNTSIDQTFIWRLIDTDGVTELGSTVGYAFNDDGYGYNVYSMYFPAADGLTWQALYSLRLSGNPAVFVTPPIYNFPVNAGDYDSANLTADAQAALTDRILAISTSLYSNWSLTPSTSLVAQLETGTVLSANGRSFFRGAVYGIQAMAPALFDVEVLTITAVDRTWNTQYSTNVTNQWAGTWVETAVEGGAALFSSDYDLSFIILLIILSVLLLIGNISLTGNAWNALVDVSVLLIVVAKLGFYPLGVLGLIEAMAFVYIGIRLFKPFRAG